MVFSLVNLSTRIKIPQIRVSTNMPKPEIYITFRLTQPEKDLLREYCEQTGRNQTDVLRELVRGLKRRMKRTSTEA